LITGMFNDDDLEDFAAIIRSKNKKRYVGGGADYQYYETKTVICHGMLEDGYRCLQLAGVNYSFH
jgi:hypothetical protein